MRVFSSKIPGEVFLGRRGRVVQSDGMDFLVSLNGDISDIIFLDPPFNLGKKYGVSKSSMDRRSDIEYEVFMARVLDEAVRILKPGGALYLYHIPIWAMIFGNLLQRNLDFQHWIAISMKNGFVRGNSLYPAHYALLYFTKGKPNSFTRPKIPLSRCRHCHELIKDYGGYTKYMRDGVNLSDVWDDISPVRHSKYKNRIPNELSPTILDRIIEISGLEHGLLVDPFVGAGTSIAAASKGRMHFIAADREREFCEIAVARERSCLNKIGDGT